MNPGDAHALFGLFATLNAVAVFVDGGQVSITAAMLYAGMANFGVAALAEEGES